LLVPVLCPFLAYMHFIVCCLLPLFWIYAFILILWPHQLGHAVDFNSHIMYLPCVFCGCPVAQLGCSSVAATVAVFVKFLQLHLVKTQAGPTPLRSSRAIKLPSCHIAYIKHLPYVRALVNKEAIALSRPCVRVHQAAWLDEALSRRQPAPFATCQQLCPTSKDLVRIVKMTGFLTPLTI